MTASETQCCFEGLFLDKQVPQLPQVLFDRYLVGGELRLWQGPTAPVVSPICRQGSEEPTVIGTFPMLGPQEALEAVEAAHRAYNYGRGEWPQMSTRQRIEAVQKYLQGLKQKRDEIVNLIQWEICKTTADAEKEVDRTILYVQDTIKALKDLENEQSTFKSEGGVIAQIRRAPYGVVLCCGPFNYPFNETYTVLLPALIMGNTVVMKLPRVGVLCHFPTLQLFKDIFPPGVVNVISGSGRETLPPIMASGKMDILAFIGTSKAASALQKAHPKPHRLRVCLGLEAKNPAIILPDANLDVAVEECILGSLSYNGQRCTALKIIFVHEKVSEAFLAKFAKAVDNLKMGLPWTPGVKITPLPEEGKPGYIRDLLQDALSKGASIINTERGGKFDRTFVAPTVVHPVTDQMRLYHEEQFGPIVPVATFSDLDEVFAYLASSPYGQQASVFSQDADAISQLVDVLVNQVSRVNINAQCQRGPDSFPFTGRKDSAYGTLSVFDALRVFSIRSLVATKDTKENAAVLSQILDKKSSNFLRMDYIF
ncbi:putative glyceraldehyde-3-phosphate dehydrogenase [Balamuthia mandrillaris]